jgi:23S rRNA A2030 N6-methylase RlmJ
MTPQEKRVADNAAEMFSVLRLASQVRLGDELKPLSDRIAAVVAKVEGRSVPTSPRLLQMAERAKTSTEQAARERRGRL